MARARMDGGPVSGAAVSGAAAKLEALTRNALSGQWSADGAIDWDQAPRLPGWLPDRVYASVVSQLYHGERATLAMCRRLSRELAGTPAETFLRTQIADEERHADIYADYLDRLGIMVPPDEAMAAAYDGALAWRGSYHAPVVAFHIVLEGEALDLLQACSKRFPCPLFRQINRRVSHDEARHIAFGKLFLRERVRMLPLDERLEIYRWVRSLWRHCAAATKARYGLFGRFALRTGPAALEARWQRQAEALAEIGLIGPGEAETFARV